MFVGSPQFVKFFDMYMNAILVINESRPQCQIRYHEK